MQVTTVSDFRNKIKEFMDAAWDNEEEIIVARPKGKNVVILSFEAFEKMRKAVAAPPPGAPAEYTWLQSLQKQS
jgi:prevent-host-death family protein